MLGHKMVPKYMKQLGLKYDSPSYKKDENRCLASGERALQNYKRFTQENTTIMFCVMRVPGVDDKDEGNFDCPNRTRAIQRKKETSI